jgi:hypothetical protein
LKVFPFTEAVVTNIQLSADGKRLSCATMLPTLEVWDIQNERAIVADSLKGEIDHFDQNVRDTSMYLISYKQGKLR